MTEQTDNPALDPAAIAAKLVAKWESKAKAYEKLAPRHESYATAAAEARHIARALRFEERWKALRETVEGMNSLRIVNHGGIEFLSREDVLFAIDAASRPAAGGTDV